MSTPSGQFKRAQIVMSCLLLCLCLVGHWILDLRRSTGCRIFMPVLTVSATAERTSVSIRDDLLGISDLLPFLVFPASPQILLTAAHESVHGFFETSQVRAAFVALPRQCAN